MLVSLEYPGANQKGEKQKNETRNIYDPTCWTIKKISHDHLVAHDEHHKKKKHAAQGGQDTQDPIENPADLYHAVIPISLDLGKRQGMVPAHPIYAGVF